MHEACDAEIATAVATSLQCHVWAPPDIHVTVENGWARLTGEVRWKLQRSAAALSSLPFSTRTGRTKARSANG
jgi:osmotically-inducible protein OsmY